jgi:hypothetical protein
MCDGVRALEKLIEQQHERLGAYERHWHLDKRVPIALIATVTGQFIMVVVLGTLMWAQIGVNRDNIQDIQKVMPEVYKMVENTQHMKEDISEMNSNLKELTKQLWQQNNGRGTGWHDGRVKGDGK